MIEKNETLVLFVPHTDDETNLAGNILPVLTERFDVFVVYTSIDTSTEKGSVRKTEGINACSVYGVRADHVLFLNFPDMPNRTGHHHFQDEDGHRKVVDAFKKVLLDKRPSVVMACDFDYHSDHRMVSIASEEAILEAVTEASDGSEDMAAGAFRPCVYKGFCYDTAWFGPADYRVRHLGPSLTDGSPLADPSFAWEERVSLKGNSRDQMIWHTRAYKAMRCHVSQMAILHAPSVINADNVFWQRRTDNAVLTGSVSVSSGDGSGLNDFKLISPHDIISMENKDIDFSCGVWKPSVEDTRPSVTISFRKCISPCRLVFHGNPASEKDTSAAVRIKAGDKTIPAQVQILGGGKAFSLQLDRVRCGGLTIEFDAISDREAFGLCEIEVFENEFQKNAQIEKMVYIPEDVPCAEKSKASRIESVNRLGYACSVFMAKVRRKLGRMIYR